MIINNSIQPTTFLYFLNQDVMIDGNPGRKIIVESSSLFKVLLRVDSLQLATHSTDGIDEKISRAQ